MRKGENLMIDCKLAKEGFAQFMLDDLQSALLPWWFELERLLDNAVGIWVQIGREALCYSV